MPLRNTHCTERSNSKYDRCVKQRETRERNSDMTNQITIHSNTKEKTFGSKAMQAHHCWHPTHGHNRIFLQQHKFQLRNSTGQETKTIREKSNKLHQLHAHKTKLFWMWIFRFHWGRELLQTQFPPSLCTETLKIVHMIKRYQAD